LSISANVDFFSSKIGLTRTFLLLAGLANQRLLRCKRAICRPRGINRKFRIVTELYRGRPRTLVSEIGKAALRRTCSHLQSESHWLVCFQDFTRKN
jgi:hypothetical protein